MAFPKIVYNSITLTFTYPPVNKPSNYRDAFERESRRNDSVSLTGKVQSVYEATDLFYTLQMDFVPFADMAAWKAFFAWAEQGNSFLYYPDSAIVEFDEFILDDVKWIPARALPSYAKFKMRLRYVVGGIHS